MTARDEAIEAAGEAIFNEEGPESIDADGAYALAQVALSAAVPLLLNDLADRIDERRAPHITAEAANVMYERGVAYGLDVARNLVRAAAEGWGA